MRLSILVVFGVVGSALVVSAGISCQSHRAGEDSWWDGEAPGEVSDGDLEVAKRWDELSLIHDDGQPLSARRWLELVAGAGELDPHEEPRQPFVFPQNQRRPPSIEAGQAAVNLGSRRADAAAKDGPLTVMTYRPSGQIDLPGQPAITFDRPVASLRDLEGQAIPQISIEPALDGQWRWVGTRTLVFEAHDEWARGTSYRVQVPPTVTAVDGSSMAEEFEFQFVTAGPKLERLLPEDLNNFELDLPIVLVFDQPVQPDWFDALTVRTNYGDRVAAYRPLEGEELAAAARFWEVEEEYRQGRVVAAAPVEELRKNQTYRIHLQGLVHSQRGEAKSHINERGSFNICPAFNIQRLDCSFMSCAGRGEMHLYFTSELADPSADLEVEMRPPVDDLSVTIRPSGTSALLEGSFEVDTTYRAVIGGDIRDRCGQRLRRRQSPPVNTERRRVRSRVKGPQSPTVLRPPGSAMVLPLVVRGAQQLRVRVYSVDTDDWQAFEKWNSFAGPGSRQQWQGRPVREEVLVLDEGGQMSNRLVEIDASAAFSGDRPGQALVIIDEIEPRPSSTPQQRQGYWIQRTDLAVDLTVSGNVLAAQVTSLSDGTVVAGAELTMGAAHPVVTDQEGWAEMELPSEEDRRRPLVITAAEDQLLMPPRQSQIAEDEWRPWRQRTDYLWYIISDGTLYRPGDVVHLQGVVRKLERTPKESPSTEGLGANLRYSVTPRGSRGSRESQPLLEGEVPLSELGSFELSFEIPDDASLGLAFLQFELEDESGQALAEKQWPISIQEFRPPRHEVEVEARGQPYFFGDVSQWVASSFFDAGLPVRNAEITWQFSEEAVHFHPPRWEGWLFGDPEAGGQMEMFGIPIERISTGAGDSGIDEYQGVTDGDGQHVVEITPEDDEDEGGATRRVTARASLDVEGGQSRVARVSALVHPASIYVGLRKKTNFVRPGQPFEIEAVVVDLEGQFVEGRPLDVVVSKEVEGKRQEVDRCSHNSTKEPQRCLFDELSSGAYRVVAGVEDEEGRMARTITTFQVIGPLAAAAREGLTAKEASLKLIPNIDEVDVGDELELFVQAPYYPIDAVVEVRQDGLYERRFQRLSADDPLISVTIEEAMIPNVRIRVRGLGADEAFRPHRFLSGTLNVPVSRSSRTLQVNLQSDRDTYEPGEDLEVALQVLDDRGVPVPDAQVLVVAVDESILGLSTFEFPDPVARFFPHRGQHVYEVRSRQWLLFEEGWPQVLESQEAEDQKRAAQQADPHGSIQFGGGHQGRAVYGFVNKDKELRLPSIPVREGLERSAFFRSDLITDEQGRVNFAEPLPERPSRYRIVALAMAGEQRFGKTEHSVKTTRSLLVRPLPPRFLNVGDRVDLPVRIHNNGDEAVTVDVALRANEGLQWLEKPGRRVEVGAGEYRQLHFAARAVDAGQVHLQALAAHGDTSDGESTHFPVLAPSMSEFFATYGSLSEEDDLVTYHLELPDQIYHELGGLEVTLSSTRLGPLYNSFLSITDRNPSSSRDVASRILAASLMSDLMTVGDGKLTIGEGEDREVVSRWVAQLEQFVQRDRGIGLTPQHRSSSSYATAHTMHALWRFLRSDLADGGSEQRAANLMRGMTRYLRQVEVPGEFAIVGRAKAINTEAYLIYVLHLLEQPAYQVRLQALVEALEVDEIPLEGLGWLLPAAADSHPDWVEPIRQRIHNHLAETAAHVEMKTDEEISSHVQGRIEGAWLTGLVATGADQALVERLVERMATEVDRDGWRRWGDDVFSLLGLRAYADVYEGEDPDFEARAWVGEQHLLEEQFQGRSAGVQTTHLPLTLLAEQEGTIILQHQGRGRLSYRLGLEYLPLVESLDARSHGFSVERSFEAVDDPDDVRRADDGWEIRLGARVEVVLTLATPTTGRDVRLVDRLPAGFEVINPAPQGSDVDRGRPVSARERRGQPKQTVSSQLGDDRVQIEALTIEEGTHSYRYLIQATTPGEFIALPASVEEMRHPEISGRSASEMVRVVGE